ncbi:hypothetical protein HNQ91_002479 [Filimonas zeae]|nr:hypothetical protein [Filimonas zeae]MDR6339428.1 hypothetical protein [Filimonas zeae]
MKPFFSEMDNAVAVDKYYLRPVPQTVIDRGTEGYPQNKGY